VRRAPGAPGAAHRGAPGAAGARAARGARIAPRRGRRGRRQPRLYRSPEAGQAPGLTHAAAARARLRSAARTTRCCATCLPRASGRRRTTRRG
jgi:hypothetical protein